ncbi:MAG: DNA mismatch repair endonuclease MutL [Treponema sp.]|jgi:DNA mismatch repair protein MutL|nr:DNA mismatch repair endonuclease MutL [Treponema sp.]
MIRILPPEEAKKIAAGEVIDRPAALAREFLDNALDSGATAVELNIEGGGIVKVEVIDNGSGMSREDLELCVKAHATSKIRSLEDLDRVTTLGFRGEALAAAAATARLEIVTSVDGREAWLLETSPGSPPPEEGPPRVTQTRRTKGTSVRGLGLFDRIPARKRFLKRVASEAALCRQVFVEKALAFPEAAFRFVQDGRLRVQLFPRDSLRERFGELILDSYERPFLHSLEARGSPAAGFQVTVIFGGPELYRRDRRGQYVFANRRRVQDYGLTQALEYGLAGFFPNGSHPLGAVYVEVDPALADFNIHPAKREVRFSDAGAIHHRVTTALRDYTRGAAAGNAAVFDNAAYGEGATASSGGPCGGEPDYPGEGPGGEGVSRGALEFGFGEDAGFTVSRERTYSHSLAMEALLDRRDERAPPPGGGTRTSGTGGAGTVRLAGRAFGLFIIAERGSALYLIDQHAAHERILYDRFLSKPITAQELLVAIPFTTGSAEEDRFLQAKRGELARLGIRLAGATGNGGGCTGGGVWRVEALPAGWKAGDGETVEEILSLRNAGENIAERWAATLACRAAIKDGGWLDDDAALALAEEALALYDKNGLPPRCPHGRPLWKALSRDELFRAVRRE